MTAHPNDLYQNVLQISKGRKNMKPRTTLVRPKNEGTSLFVIRRAVPIHPLDSLAISPIVAPREVRIDADRKRRIVLSINLGVNSSGAVFRP